MKINDIMLVSTNAYKLVLDVVSEELRKLLSNRDISSIVVKLGDVLINSPPTPNSTVIYVTGKEVKVQTWENGQSKGPIKVKVIKNISRNVKTSSRSSESKIKQGKVRKVEMSDPRLPVAEYYRNLLS